MSNKKSRGFNPGFNFVYHVGLAVVLSLFHKVVVFSECVNSFIYLVVIRNFFNRLLCSFIGTYKFFSARLGMLAVNIKHCFLLLPGYTAGVGLIGLD